MLAGARTQNVRSTERPAARLTGGAYACGAFAGPLASLRAALLASLLLAALVATLAPSVRAEVPSARQGSNPSNISEPKLKVGFIYYLSPVGDNGWTHAHDQARRRLEAIFPWLETVYAESVPPGGAGPIIDQMVRENVNVIFSTSFGFLSETLEAAARHPGVHFGLAMGYERAPNVMTYSADLYQAYYLNGLIAGALTRSGKVGYVGAVPIPEVKRHISAFALGVRAVRPAAEVHVRWIDEWFNPEAARGATEALIAEGADVFAFSEDSPTVVEAAAQHGLPSFGHYSPMYSFAPDYVVSGQLANWEVIYADFLAKVYAGFFASESLEHVDYWWLLAQGAVTLGAEPGMPINPKYEAQLKGVTVDHAAYGEISVYDLVFALLEDMSDPQVVFDPFQGPIYDRNGILRVPEGKRLSQEALMTMEWAAPGIVGPWPNEPVGR